MPKLGRKILVLAAVSLVFQSGFSQKHQENSAKFPQIYQKHLLASKKLGIKKIETSKQLNSAKKNGQLIYVKSAGKGYQIMKLDYSQPVLIFDAKQILKQISAEFFKKSGHGTFTVTSLTRTVQTQKKLRTVNKNASLGESTHNFGNAFDLSYMRFNGKLGDNPKLENLLESILKKFQNSGKIYYIKEKKQRCFHVTVR